MNRFEEYDDHDAVGLAQLVDRGEISPLELCEEAICRAEAVNPALNAIITPMYELARKVARTELPDGPLRGVPFLLKDILAEYAGVPQSNGSAAMRDYVPQHDNVLVQRYKRAGLVVFGKTNTPELGMMGVTEPEAFGPTRNPWDLRRTPGGSSGGTAAAVAARIVPAASGGDGGGSIRIPASCCGLFGLKASRGRQPTSPFGELWGGAVVPHVLSISVRDSAALLDATQGADPGVPYVIAPPQRPYLEEVGTEPGRLRIAFSRASPLGTEVDGDCVAAVEHTAHLLQTLGHDVEENCPQYDAQRLIQAFLLVYFASAAAEIAGIAELLGKPLAQLDIEQTTRIAGLVGRSIRAPDFVQAKNQWNEAARAMGRFQETYDLFLTPTLARPPVPIGELTPHRWEKLGMRVVNSLHLGRLLRASGIVESIAKRNTSWFPFTQLANITGQPAASLPLYWNDANLPIGTQLMARNGDEALLFRVAAQLERAQPWFQRRPPLCAGAASDPLPDQIDPAQQH